MYGLYDTVDGCWLGDDAGQAAYRDEELAEIAAQVQETRLRWSIGRVRARVLPEEVMRQRDSLPVHLTALEALWRIEGCDDGSVR